MASFLASSHHFSQACHRQVQTDMGNGAANMMGLEKAPVTIDQSVSGMVRNVRNPCHTVISTSFQGLTCTDRERS